MLFTEGGVVNAQAGLTLRKQNAEKVNSSKSSYADDPIRIG